MIVYAYAFLMLVAAALTVSVWMSGRTSSKHLPIKLPADPERLKPRLLMLLILVGYILAFLISAGVFAGGKKPQPPITVPIMSQDSTFAPIDQVPSFPSKTDGPALSATLFFQFTPKTHLCGTGWCARAANGEKEPCKNKCDFDSNKDK